jgi:hypothetical protein
MLIGSFVMAHIQKIVQKQKYIWDLLPVAIVMDTTTIGNTRLTLQLSGVK